MWSGLCPLLQYIFPYSPLTLLPPFCPFILWLETAKHTGHRAFAFTICTTWMPSPFGPFPSLVVPKVWSLDQAAAVSPGNLLEMVILGPAPDLVNQKLWGSFGHPAMFLTSPPGDSNAHSSLRTTGLAQSHPYAKVHLRQCYCKTSTPRQGLVLTVICPHFPLLISMKYYCSYDVIINCFMSVSLHS